MLYKLFSKNKNIQQIARIYKQKSNPDFSKILPFIQFNHHFSPLSTQFRVNYTPQVSFSQQNSHNNAEGHQANPFENIEDHIEENDINPEKLLNNIFQQLQ